MSSESAASVGEMEQTEKPDELTSAKNSTQSNKHVTYRSILKEDPLYNEVSNVLHWQDPIRSGLILGIITLTYFLLNRGGYTVVTLVNYLFLSILTVSFGYVKFFQWKSSQPNGNPFSGMFGTQNFHVSKERAQQHLDTLVALINHTIDGAREVFYCKDPVLSLYFLNIFFFAGWIGSWFSGETILFLTCLGFFIWPRLYQEKHAEIDRAYLLALSEGKKYYAQGISALEKKVPPAAQPYVQYLKPKSS